LRIAVEAFGWRPGDGRERAATALVVGGDLDRACATTPPSAAIASYQPREELERFDAASSPRTFARFRYRNTWPSSRFPGAYSAILLRSPASGACVPRLATRFTDARGREASPRRCCRVVAQAASLWQLSERMGRRSRDGGGLVAMLALWSAVVFVHDLRAPC